MILAMLIMTAVGCGSNDRNEKSSVSDSTPSGEESTAPEQNPDKVPDIDMNGFTLSILHNNPEKMTWTNMTLDVAEQTGEAFEEAIYKRNRKIESRFNCSIEVTEIGDDVFQIGNPEISKAVMSDDTTYDVWFPRDYNVISSIPYLRPLSDLPYIDLDADEWFPLASSIYRFGDTQWAATSYFSLSMISRAAGFAFNKDIYETIGAEKTPYEYVRDNEWTLDKLAEVARLGYFDMNGDGQIDKDDRFGIGSGWRELYMRFILGSGVNFISRDADGMPEYILPTDQIAIDKMQRIFELFNDKSIYYNRSKGDMNSVAAGLLETGTNLFVISHPNAMCTKWRYLDADIGFVPCPKYESAQDRYYAPTYAGEMMVILQTLPEDRMENIGALLQALSYAGMTDVLPVYRENSMKSKAARDEESEQMFDIVVDSMSFDFGLIAWEQVVNSIIQKIYASGKGDVVSSLVTLKPNIEKVIASGIENINGTAK